MHNTYLGRSDRYTLSPVKPQEVDDVDLAFPADVGRLMPSPEELAQIPKEYLRDAENFVTTWFHIGLDNETRYEPAPGVDMMKALRHISACMRSFEPKHEDKILGCACLVTRFFENIKYAPEGMTGDKWTSFMGFTYLVQKELSGN